MKSFIFKLAAVLDINPKLIQNAVSLYCRLGFAYKKNLDSESFVIDQSWKKYQLGLAHKRYMVLGSRFIFLIHFCSFIIF